MTGVKVVAGDWSDGELGTVMAPHVAANCADLVKRAANCTRTLIFGCTVAHCEQIAAALQSHGWTAPIVTGTTPDAERDYLTRSIRSGEIRALVNCQVLTTGFDAPGIDCVAIMRPTKSAGLYYQMAGRGFRIAEGKDFCTICDYGGNILRHGPLDRLRIKKRPGDLLGVAPMKACPECQEVLPLAARECPCGWLAPPIEAKTAPVASDAAIIGMDEARELTVQDWQAASHKSKAGTTTLRVDHEISLFKCVSEWICFEHTGYPRLKAEEWWLRHGGKHIPKTVGDAVARFRELRRPASIFVQKDGKYDKITRRTFPRSETLR
jgi:DNA repair protein RadD